MFDEMPKRPECLFYCSAQILVLLCLSRVRRNAQETQVLVSALLCSAQVKLVSPSLMPKLGKAGSLQSRHAIDIIARFGKQESMPREFFTDFVKVAQDEGRHFTLLAGRLKELGSFCGALPAHDGLWDSVIATSKDLLALLAIEHCVHEARGLDVVPTTISRLRNGGDNQTAELLENVVYPEEITHCAAGVKWFKYLCLRSRNPNLSDLPSEENSDTVEVDIEVIQKFHSTITQYNEGLSSPISDAHREKLDIRYGDLSLLPIIMILSTPVVLDCWKLQCRDWEDSSN
ncbi:hypothetical protein RND71_014986 [Anisodus tanguticus]|uniref:Ferritin n=1 Tax=Anisodus tanguticus TaxID=243964 RepID=A0AAE1VKD4_9SOLA|nr:hypothetical protein RND71_014986 [Anisodus tanguticus]